MVVWSRERCNEKTHNPRSLGQDQCPGEAGEHENEVQISSGIKEWRSQEADSQEYANKKHNFADNLEVFRKCWEQVKSKIRKWRTLDVKVISYICRNAMHVLPNKCK